MPEAVDVKVIQVGNALGLLLPARVVKAEKIRKGQTVTLSVWKKKKLNLESLLGKYKGTQPFVRDHGPHD